MFRIASGLRGGGDADVEDVGFVGQGGGGDGYGVVFACCEGVACDCCAVEVDRCAVVVGEFPAECGGLVGDAGKVACDSEVF